MLADFDQPLPTDDRVTRANRGPGLRRSRRKLITCATRLRCPRAQIDGLGRGAIFVVLAPVESAEFADPSGVDVLLEGDGLAVADRPHVGHPH